MGVLGAVFTLREWAWLYIAGIWLYLVLIPFVEAAEQTVIQQVVPLPRQGRVFGFAMAFESAAAPITAFLIAPIAQVWIIPYARSAEGAAQLAPLLGEGISRGIALVFLVAGIIMIVAALLAFLTPVYRRVSASYAQDGCRGAGDGEHRLLVLWMSKNCFSTLCVLVTPNSTGRRSGQPWSRPTKCPSGASTRTPRRCDVAWESRTPHRAGASSSASLIMRSSSSTAWAGQ